MWNLAPAMLAGAVRLNGGFMKAVLTKTNLLEGIRAAGHAISTRTALPILGHVLISSQDGELVFSATDHQVGISAVIPAQILEEGEMTVLATLAAEVFAALPESDVILESNDQFQVKVTCPPAEYQLMGLPPKEFPGLPEVPDEVWFEIDAKELRQGLKRTSFACSTDELRSIMMGVFFSFTGDTLRLVATDTHRLAMDIRVIANGDGEASAVVPSKAVNELSRLLPESGTVRIHISHRQVMFQLGHITLTATLIEGQFPNYERVIPTQFDKKWVLPTSLFSPAVKRAAIVGREDMNRVVLKTSGEKIIIQARAGSVGRAYEEVEAVRDGDDVEVAFNAQFLLDVLNVIETEGVQIDLFQPLSPAVVRPVDQDDYLCVVMPMQVNEGLSEA